MVAQQLLRVDSLQYGYDGGRKFLLARAELTDMQAVDSVRLGAQGYRLLDRVDYRRPSRVVRDSDTLTLAFTRLPLVVLDAPKGYNRTTKLPGTLRYADDEQVVIAAVGGRHRGSFSLRFPKKSYDLELREDATDRVPRDVSLAGMRKDDDWVLDALYNERERINSYVVHQLWLDMHRPYYHLAEPKARAGADVRYVEVFFRGSYDGVYMLGEQVDRKQLQLRETKKGEVRGTLYKGVAWTNTTRLLRPAKLPPPGATEYGGWEVKYPRVDSFDWTALHELVGFVGNSSDSAFRAGVLGRFTLDNLVDYQLLLNVAYLTDNHGKNTYLAHYREGEPYFYAPWDLDASLGNTHNGQRFENHDGWIANHLFRRLEELNVADYTQRMCDRYVALRRTVFDPKSLQGRVDAARDYLETNGVYQRETARWGNVDLSAAQRNYTDSLVSYRLDFVEDRLCGTSSTVPISVLQKPLRVYPNPVGSELTVRHDGETSVGYRVYSLVGQQLLTGQLPPKEGQIRVDQLVSGTYILQVDGRVSRFVVYR